MTAPELTLNGIRNSLPKKERVFRVSDFLNDDEKQQNLERKAKRKTKKRRFSQTDAIVAEMVSRFGYEFYLAWNEGEIDEDLAYRMLYAERAREAEARLKIEGVLVPLIKDCIKRSKKEKKPTGPRDAAKIIKLETKIAMGEQ